MDNNHKALAVIVDTELAAIYGELARLDNRIVRQEETIIRLAGGIKTVNYKPVRTMEFDEAVQCGPVAAQPYELSDWGRDLAQREEDVAARDALIARYVELDKVWEKAGRWSRFFLVTSSKGHVHSSLNCSTCRSNTEYGWLPELSGLNEADAVRSQGEILCSVCFPSAPVDWTNGSSKSR